MGMPRPLAFLREQHLLTCVGYQATGLTCVGYRATGRAAAPLLCGRVLRSPILPALAEPPRR